MKLLKILIRVGVGLLVFLGFVLTVRAVLNFTEGRALSHALAGLKAKGIPLTVKDLAPPCPDEDNAARLWKAYENVTTIPGRPNAQAVGGHADRTAGERRSSRDNSVRGLISRAWQAYQAGRPLDRADKAALKDVILKNQRAFELVAQMGAKPCFLYRDPAEYLVESRLPDAVQMIQTTELLFFSALFSAEDGDMSGAVDRLITGLKFSPLVAREGTLIAYLISVGETRILSQFLGEVCRDRAVGDADLVRLMNALDPGPWRERLAASFRGERIIFIEAGQEFLKTGLGDLGSVFEGSSWWEKLGLWVLRPFLKADIRQSLPGLEFLEAQAKDPYYESRERLRAHDRGLERRPWYAFLSKMIFGNSEAAYLKEAQIEATYMADRTGLACRLYKSRTGRYPERLEELVPVFLSEVPTDPFTGKPMIYRREGEGFIVYSLGSNQKDDGGRSTYMITQLVMPKDDDWSWREDK